MSSKNDSIQKTLIVALLLCLVCSIVVSSAAVLLKPLQVENRELDKKRNILAAAGIETEGQDINALFEQFDARVVDLETGRYTDEVDAASYDQAKASKDPDWSKRLSKEEDIAGINRQERYAVVYLLMDGDQLQKVILPVRGYGLWSTMHGFMALEGDLNTLVGLGFYQHAETPGLGGEIDNPLWKAQWVGKKVYDPSGEVALGLAKNIDPQSEQAQYQVDALSGATLTGNGVTNLVHFWLGDSGFRNYLKNLQAGDV